MRVDIGSATGDGQISDTSDPVMVIEFHARAGNQHNAYVGMSDVGENNGRELQPGEPFTLNFAAAYEVDRRHPDILFSQFYTLVKSGDYVDWSVILR